MMALGLIALIAGAASAVMFASIVSGALISLALFYFAPLPLMVAAIGWGPFSASLGGIAAAIGVGLILDFHHLVAFAAMVAVPAWWLGHLALLGRPAAAHGASVDHDTAPPEIEWYPLGRILLWIAAFAVLITIGQLLTLGTDADAITGAMRRGLLRIFALAYPEGTGDIESLIDALIVLGPGLATMVTMVTLTVNLWLAAKVTATSGRLHRPWPNLKSVALPTVTLAALGIAIVSCFAGGLVTIFARIVTTALMMAYALTGFAVLHTVTLALKSRAFWLVSTYVIAATFGWPVIFIAMLVLGLADAVFGLRERFLRSRPPPLPSPEIQP